MGSRKLYMVCIALWFALWGILALTNVQFAQSGFIMGILALAAVVLYAFDR